MRLGSYVAVAVCRPAATALIQPLARELPYDAGVALKSKKKKKKKKNLGEIGPWSEAKEKVTWLSHSVTHCSSAVNGNNVHL